MKIDKKNTPFAVEKAKVKKDLSHDTLVEDGAASVSCHDSQQKKPVEINGPKGPEPTRYGDWEQKGRCTDF